MLNRSLLKTSLLIAGLSTLGACGSDSDSSDDDLINSPTTSDSTDVDGVSDDDPATADTDVDNVDAGNPGLANPVPQFVTAACDPSLISATPFSNSATAPALFAPNEIVRGRIDFNSDTSTQHFWNIDLQPGFYHVILDTRRVDDGNDFLRLDLVDINGGPGGQSDRNFFGTALERQEFRFRQSAFIEVETAETLNLQVTSVSFAQDYTLGIFENGSAIPSPVTEECPTIVTLGIDSTESLMLPEAVSESDDRFFQIELEAGDYTLNSTASAVDGPGDSISYRIESADRFGENDRFDEVINVSELDILG